jgi:MFS family permease
MPGLGHYLMQMVRAGPAVVIPLYGSTVLGLGVEQIGLIFGAASAIDMTLFYPTGIIMDRFGRKWAIVPSALIMGIGLAVIPFTTSFIGLMLAAMLNGFGNGLGSGVMLTLGADLAPPETRGEFIGLWSLIGDAGVTSGPVAIGAVADVLALQPAIWAIAAVGLGAGLVFGRYVPETLQKKIGN